MTPRPPDPTIAVMYRGGRRRLAPGATGNTAGS
jgi:hypothetical protein